MRRWITTRCGVTSSLAALCALLAPLDARASNGVEAVGVNPRARMRGGADVALGDSALSQIDNPATLAATDPHRKRFDFATQLFLPEVIWHGPLETSRSSVTLIPVADAALAWPAGERLFLGLAIHAKSGLASRFNIRPLLFPLLERPAYADAKNVALYLSAAWRLNDRLALGAGVRIEAVSAEFRAPFGPIDAKFGRGYGFGAGFQLGLHYRLTETLTLGLAYRSPGWVSDIHGGRLKASLFGLLPIPLGEGRIDEVRLPQRLAFGLAWQATPRLRLLGEVRWIDYSRSTFHDMTVAADGPLPLRIGLPLGYRDQWVFILGAEYALTDRWTLAAGYNYARNPVPRDHVIPIGSIIAEHHISVGLRYDTPRWWAGVGYVLGFGKTLRANGFSRLPLGIDYAFGELDQTQHSIVVGFGIRW